VNETRPKPVEMISDDIQPEMVRTAHAVACIPAATANVWCAVRTGHQPSSVHKYYGKEEP